MITIIFGAPGSGKSSLNTYFLKELYRAQGKSIRIEQFRYPARTSRRFMRIMP